MRLNNKQAMVLLKIAEDSIKEDVIGLFSYDFETRLRLINDIYNQQSEELKELFEESDFGNRCE